MTDPDLRQRFLNGMRHAAATVNVVTTDGRAGRSGITVSAMSSVSADAQAPIILICLHHLSKSAPVVIDNGAFVVNVLREDQSFISDTFAGRRAPPGDDKFSCVEWTAMSTGCPRVVDPLVAFDCRILKTSRIGSHHVILGEVKEIFIADSGKPLIYADRSYGSAERILPFRAEDHRPGGALRIGALSSFGPEVLPPLFGEFGTRRGAAPVDLYEGDQRKIAELLRAGDLDLALLSDVELGGGLKAELLERRRPHALLPADHPLAARGEVGLRELSPHPLILLDAPPMRRYLLSLFESLELHPNVAYRPWGAEMARSMVAHGLGYGLVAPGRRGGARRLDDGTVTSALADDLPPLRMVLARRAGALPPPAQAFLELCLERYRAPRSRTV